MDCPANAASSAPACEASEAVPTPACTDNEHKTDDSAQNDAATECDVPATPSKAPASHPDVLAEALSASPADAAAIASPAAPPTPKDSTKKQLKRAANESSDDDHESAGKKARSAVAVE